MGRHNNIGGFVNVFVSKFPRHTLVLAQVLTAFAAEATGGDPQALHDLMVDREPDRIVIEICSIAGWVSDLVRALA